MAKKRYDVIFRVGDVVVCRNKPYLYKEFLKLEIGRTYIVEAVNECGSRIFLKDFPEYAWLYGYDFDKLESAAAKLLYTNGSTKLRS